MHPGSDRISVVLRNVATPLPLAVLVMLLLPLLSPARLSAGSWPMQRRATYFSVGYRGFSGVEYFGRDGTRLGLHRLEEQTLAFSSEYGYSKYVSALVQLPAFRKLYAQTSADAPLLSVQSPGDVDLGLRFTVWPGAQDAISLTALFGIPLGESTQAAGLWAGDNEYNQLIQLRYGHAFDFLGTFVQLESGYNFRSGGYADELRVGGEVGFHPMDAVELKFQLHAVSSQGNGDPDFHGGSFGFASNNQRYVMFGPEASVWLTDGMGVSLGFLTITEARNMPAATLLTTGLFFLLTPRADR